MYKRNSASLAMADKADYEFVVVGAGPGGLQMGYFLEESKQSYAILEASGEPGYFFHKYPRHRKLISVNKRFNGFPEDDYNWRHDWNSLLSSDPEMRFTKYSDQLFPDADDLCRYLKDYVERFNINIKYNWKVTKISRQDSKSNKHKSVFTLEGDGGKRITCNVLLMATGCVSEKLPDVEGIHLADTYGTHPLELKQYENKFVCVIGGGNSAFETADHLAGHAASVQLLVQGPVKMAWDTHFVGNLRAVNNNVIDMYHLKSLHGIRNVIVKKLERVKDKLALTFDIHLPHYREPGPGTGTFTSKFDSVIVATGWNYIDLDLFAEGCKPETHTDGKYPVLKPNWETTVPDLYYLGTAMQARDRRAASGFIHGFRYTVTSCYHLLRERYHGLPTPRKEFLNSSLDDVVTFMINRISTVPSLYQMNQGVLCDVVLFDLDAETNGHQADLETKIPGTVTYLMDLPSVHVVEQDWFKQHKMAWLVTLEEEHDLFPASVPSTGFFSLPELHVHSQPCTPFVRGAYRRYSGGQHVETLFLNGSVLVRHDISLFVGDNSIARVRNQVKNLLCRTTELARDDYEENLFEPDQWKQVFRPWTQEEIESFREKEAARKKMQGQPLCPRFGFLEQPEVKGYTKSAMEATTREVPAVTLDDTLTRKIKAEQASSAYINGTR